MTALLHELEQQGYRFRLDGEQVMVRGPGLGDQAMVERLRQHKAEIKAEIMVRQFIDLVRITAACDHHILLHRDQIAAQLDTKDHAALLETARRDRQVWAELLAYRLTRSRISS